MLFSEYELVNIIQFLNQIDLARLSLTCKTYYNNKLIQQCLKTIQSFLNQKSFVFNIPPESSLFIKLCCKSIDPNEEQMSSVFRKNYFNITNLLINGIEENTIFYSKSCFYKFNIDLSTNYNVYYVLPYANIVPYSKFYQFNIKTVKVDGKVKNYYFLNPVEINPCIHPPYLFYQIETRLRYNFNNWNYKIISDVYFDVYFTVRNTKQSKITNKINKIHYTACEFNIKNCVSKVVYLVKAKIFESKHLVNDFIMDEKTKSPFTFIQVARELKSIINVKPLIDIPISKY